MAAISENSPPGDKIFDSARFKISRFFHRELTPELLRDNRYRLERELPSLHLDNKAVWLYLISKLGYIDRDEVEGFTQRLALASAEGVQGPISVFELCLENPKVRERTPNDFMLKHISLKYEPLVDCKTSGEVFSPEMLKIHKKYPRAVDVRSKGLNMLLDLYVLESVEDVYVDRRFDKEKHEWEERFSLTGWGVLYGLDAGLGLSGRDDALCINHLLYGVAYPRIRKDNNLMIVTTPHDARVVSKTDFPSL